MIWYDGIWSWMLMQAAVWQDTDAGAMPLFPNQCSFDLKEKLLRQVAVMRHNTLSMLSGLVCWLSDSLPWYNTVKQSILNALKVYLTWRATLSWSYPMTTWFNLMLPEQLLCSTAIVCFCVTDRFLIVLTCPSNRNHMELYVARGLDKDCRNFSLWSQSQMYGSLGCQQSYFNSKTSHLQECPFIAVAFNVIKLPFDLLTRGEF